MNANIKVKLQSFIEKSKVTKIIISDTESCPVQLESGSLISYKCHAVG